MVITLPNLIGWIGNVGFILGLILIARKKVAGFYFNILGNVSYLIVCALVGLPSGYVISAVMIGLNTYGIVKWRRKK